MREKKNNNVEHVTVFVDRSTIRTSVAQGIF